MNKLKIGWIGLGNMGTPMVKNLVKAGFEVMVYNRNQEKTKALQETIAIRVAGSPADLVTETDVIVTMLSDDTAVKEVFLGENGILSIKPVKDITAVDMSTVSPETTLQLAATCKEHGFSYLDAPVSGSVKPAEEAQLIIMVGGEEEVYQKVKPVFDALGKSSVYLGENGKANVAKLAINLFLGITVQGLAEAVVFAEKNGLAATTLLPLINAGAVGSGMTKMKTENIINNDFKAAFALKLLAKDIRLAGANGLNTPIGLSLSNTLDAAVQKGLGEDDMIAVLKYISEN
ncbi:3-hydroxyisobutyrate dehydrogenase [Pedobacter cryoconitis]|uniref:3-hydroxyisobutyrate dehydrogenase n=1 Tax=Pedobacter cryoconitis TaxID=188932 RepID=A0A7W8ZPL2_9SPHI|nr:NAD(P)-dependent oxidoreductase [Pedobacter cryoconitis]MBB5637859.1 3-hydroxyisobutyrate dehydrogenase [Pedobacter cryoconitis]